MTTLQDFFVTLQEVGLAAEFFGASKTFQTRFDDRTAALGLAIAEENGVSFEAAEHLPRQTRLGKKAGRHFQKLKIWLSRQHDSFR